MSLEPIRSDEELFAEFIPPALEHCKVMRPGDMENASVVIGAAVWRTFCFRERRRVGRLFKHAVERGDLPLLLAPKGKSTSLLYKLKPNLSDLRVPGKRSRLPVPPAPPKLSHTPSGKDSRFHDRYEQISILEETNQ